MGFDPWLWNQGASDGGGHLRCPVKDAVTLCCDVIDIQCGTIRALDDVCTGHGGSYLDISDILTRVDASAISVVY